MSIVSRIASSVRRLPLVEPPTATRYPFPPFPRGWFALAFSESLRPGALRTVRFLGRELVLWRGASGAVHATDPACPHLGAHLGEGGAVVGDTLRCPMHHFCFDGDGACVATPYGTRPPPAARAKMLPVVERGGFIFAKHDPADQSPAWDLPELADASWGESVRMKFTMRTHVQDIAENTVDIGHFGPTHGYSGVELLEPVRTEPNLLVSRYALNRSANIYGRAEAKIRVDLTINLHGLGLYVIDGVTEPGHVLTRTVFAATPVADGEVRFRIRMWVKDVGDSRRVSGAMSLVPEAVHRRFILQMSRIGVWNDVGQDVRILNRKRYVERPALAQGDGRFPQFRAWARQFYPPAADGAGAPG